MKKFRVKLAGTDFAYTVDVDADEGATMKEFAEKARDRIKRKYKVDIPADAPVDIEFEIIG